ncbi:MAG TPA: hypothetical protein VLB29_18365 [Nocardioidaceae bacterium]|nr:hypothetical protein [Nocardioidaceae bacterium]
MLHTALARVELDHAEACHLVLTDFTFCDVCAFRHLLSFAERVRSAGRRFDAHDAGPPIRKLAGLLSATSKLNFV